VVPRWKSDCRLQQAERLLLKARIFAAGQ
jgi:hypothetical protein